MTHDTTPLLSVQHLCRYFGTNHAVEDVSFDITSGEVFGLVGESGCGKTTVGRCIMGLYPPTSGRIEFDGHCVAAPRGEWERETPCRGRKRRLTRAGQIQMIFQDPMASLDPRMTVGEIIGEGLLIHGGRRVRSTDIRQRVLEMMERVGLDPAYVNRYPHEFSGGQRQRIGVARAVIMHPRLIIADEPVSALDVSVQAQVINLLDDLRREMGLTVLFVAHDLSVVKYFSHRIGVMYRGQLLEIAPADDLFAHPLHPYTQALLSAIPLPDPHLERQRHRLTYEPRTVPDEEGPQAMREIVPDHWVLCTEEEGQRYRNGLGGAHE